MIGTLTDPDTAAMSIKAFMDRRASGIDPYPTWCVYVMGNKIHISRSEPKSQKIALLGIYDRTVLFGELSEDISFMGVMS
ncbi:MAG TPA: hypothetical protein VN828_15730 [Acidobacteriaceae bacterium]|nr:hypothetical protein [Acidobacteriaceae bacterium]